MQDIDVGVEGYPRFSTRVYCMHGSMKDGGVQIEMVKVCGSQHSYAMEW